VSALLLTYPRNASGPKTGWPCCLRDACVTEDGLAPLVQAYGISEETADYIDLWVSHHGERDGVRIRKDAMWGPHVLGDLVLRLGFFSTRGTKLIYREHVPGRNRRVLRASASFAAHVGRTRMPS
jgi:hypothetical protein